MGVGFIQLLTVGNEIELFNYNPNISFFKIYYRRHTNFFINNMVINGNSLNINSESNILNKQIQFKIPMDGDLLTKSYLHLEFNDYHFELFKFNSELYSTLNNSFTIVSFYDNYYIKTNNYSIKNISFISTIKIIYKNKSNIIIMSNVTNNDKIIQLIMNEKFINLQCDQNNIYYNMDLTNYFYSFDVDLTTNILDNNLFNYLYSDINYINLDYIQIDFLDKKISLRIFYYNKNNYKYITSLLNSTNYIIYIKNIRIDSNYVYYTCFFDNDLFKNIIKLMYFEVVKVSLEVITNKINSGNIIIENNNNNNENNINNKIINLILNKNYNTYVYLQIYNSGNNSESQITIMGDITFFGNMTNEYFNNLLLYDSNKIMYNINVCDNRMSLIVLTRIFISLICYNDIISIQEYLNIVNGKKIKLVENFKYYENNIDILQEKLITNFMNPDILIVSKKSFYILTYSKNIYKYFYTKKYSGPFINKNISLYTQTIINSYLYSSIISTFNNYLNDNVNDFNLKIMQLIFTINFYGNKSSIDVISKQMRENYISNNFLFNLFTSNTNYIDDNLKLINGSNNFNYLNNTINTESFSLIYLLIKNVINLFITESLTILDYITNKLSICIYNTNGNLSSLFNNSNYSTCIFPLSSNIFIFTNNTNEKCTNNNSNNDVYFNKPYLTMMSQLEKNIIHFLTSYFNLHKTNISNSIEFSLLNLINYSDLFIDIKNYYTKSINITDELDLDSLNYFLNSINNIEYQYIYFFTNDKSLNFNNEIMYQFFNYVDTNLYNNAFSSFSYQKYSDCNSSVYNTNLKTELNYLKFIFSINSPLYRIYFLFTFLSKYTIDYNISCGYGYNYNNDNINSNTQSDINTLRDLCLSFVINYLYYFNNYDIKFINDNSQLTKFNLNIINNPNYILSNNFICCDKINILDNQDFNNKLRDINSDNYMLIYNSFYFLQQKNNNIEIKFSTINNIPNICNDFKYNFDDIIILLFLNVLKINSNFFINFNSVYELVLNFMNKYNCDYTKILESFLKININGSNTQTNNIIIKILKNDFYLKCYSSTFMLGTNFDNTFNLNINTINKIFSLTFEYDLLGFNYEFSFKTPNVKKSINYLSNENIINCLKYYLSSLFIIFDTKNSINVQYIYNYLDSMINYTNSNCVYFYLYLISEFNFGNCVGIINKYINIYNLINSSNINLQQNDNTIIYNTTNFTKYNFIIIIYYYLYFISKCLVSDINNYNSEKTNKININFGDYIKFKYTKNIYYECIEELINIFANTTNIIMIDFSTYYYSEIINLDNLYSDKYYSNILTNSNIYGNFEYNYINNRTDLLNSTERLKYTTVNTSDEINVNSVSNLTNNVIQLKTYFNNFYYSQIYNLTSKINNILFPTLGSNLYQNNDIIENYIDRSLVTDYNALKTYYYNSSIYLLNLSIYKKLYNSYHSNIININNKYSDKICNLIFDILKNFTSQNQDNYFNSMYYLNKTLLYKNNINIFNNDICDENIYNKDTINNLNELNTLTTIYYFYSKYINILITNSIKFEKEINRIIYFLCTNYLIQNSHDKINMKKKIYSKTLYDIVKLYLFNDNININLDNNNNNNKSYLVNTSIYSNQSVFKLLNYENLIDNISLTQNYWINNIIEKISTDINDKDSYYFKFMDFIIYVKFHNLDSNLFLQNGTSVFEYFKNIDNYEEFCELIYNYVCLNDYFSPMYIFNNIVDLENFDNISSKLKIDTDYIKKKIVIFLFFNYLILSFLPKLLIDNIEINENIILEYTIDDIIYNIALKDVLSNNKNMEIIKWSIFEIYNFSNPTNFDENIASICYPDFLQNYQDIIFIVKYSKTKFSSIPYYNLLFNKFVSSYNLVIGNELTNTNQLISIEQNSTYTNLIANINVIFNNDTNINNTNSYDLTFYSLKILDIKLSNIIYDLNNTQQNKIYNSSSFTNNSKNIYTKAQINDFNMVYNLLCLLLKIYNIGYTNLNNDINIIINNFRIGSNPINDVLEYYKGYVSELKLSLNLSPVEEIDKSQNYMNRLYVVRNLTELTDELNNLSLITPNDYDDIVFIDFNYSYKNFFQKYYLYDYNYYNFSKNNKIIFEKLYSYYNTIVANTNAITNIKNHSTYLYIWMFIDIINSYIADKYYLDIKQPILYIEQLNIITSIYLKYNYKFRLNSNISNTQNLKIQYEYGNFENKKTYTELINYLVKYYYYQIFSSDIDIIVGNSFKNDLLIFFNTLNNIQNIDFYYTQNFYNLVLKIEIVIRFIIYKVNKLYKTNGQNNIDIKIIDYEKNIIELRNKLISYFIDIQNIEIFFNLKNIGGINGFNINEINNSYESNRTNMSDENNLNNPTNQELFSIIENSINKNLFYKIFSTSVKNLIYWINNFSYEQNSFNIWNEYFQNFIFKYYVYSDNQYKIFSYKLSLDNFNFLIYNYINYILLKNDGINNHINIEFTSLYNSIFSYTRYKNKVYIFEPIIINKILFQIDDNQITNNQDNNIYLYNNNSINSVFYNIILLITNKRWGSVINYSTNVKPNDIIKGSILYLNYYYSYLNYLNTNTNITTDNSYNFDYYNEIFNELYILYYFILITITCSYVNSDMNYDLMDKMLIKANSYIEFGNKIYCVNLTNNFSIYMDNLGSNIIKNNYISNFYKKIQNISIYDNIKYKINNFKENIYNYDDYIINIFNKQYTTLLINSENIIGYNTFFNIMINTLNNFTSDVELYVDNEKIIINIYHTLFSSLNKCISVIKEYLGGEDNNNIILNKYGMDKIFNINNLKNEKSIITIFTMIFKNFDEGKILNNIIIIMFYNLCFLIWSTLGINILVNSDIYLKLYYILANVINNKIIDYIEFINTQNEDIKNTKNESINTFFNNMNILLFKNYNNNELVTEIVNFFKNVINDYLYNNNETNYSIELYQLINNTKLDNNIFNNNKNFKIINWIYLIGLCVDYNNSSYTKNFKSILNIYTDEQYQQKIMDYIFMINGRFINEYGIIKIINNLQLLFDDEIISVYTGLDYKTYLDNFQNINKEKLLNEMLDINILPEFDNIKNGIKPYIKHFNKKTYIIPIKFFFEKYFNSIQMIAMIYTKIILQIQLENNNIFKDTYYIKNLTNSIINSYLDLNYIILERDERKSICEKKIDNLIERTNNYSLVKNIINLKDYNNLYDYSYSYKYDSKYIKINFDFDLNNLIKELIWTFELHIDNYKLIIIKDFMVKNPLNFIYNNIYDKNIVSDFSFIVNTKFLIDGVRRDGVDSLDNNNNKTYNAITTILNPYKYNTKVLLDKNYNTYSFGLEPTDFQPNGAFNMSNITTFTIQVEINLEKLLAYIKNLNILYKLDMVNFNILLRTFEYNFVRYQSGLSGLLFIQ